MYKTILILIYFCFTASTEYAQIRKLEKRKHSVNKTLKQIISYPDFKNADFGFTAKDIKTGEIIASYHSDKSFMPASTQKLFTTATALEVLGPDFKFTTSLQYSGRIDTVSGILYGNILIKGGGDPTLGSKYFDSTKDKQFFNDWLKAIKKLGIDSVAGAVVADASVFDYNIVPITWSWNNMGNYYGAGANGLTVFDNYYTVFFNISNTIGELTEIVNVIPNIPNLVFDNTSTSDSITYDNSYIFGAPFSNQRYVRGKLPAGKNNF
ncbi:MAG: D-alanyl-D-alanine carboxypeptidase/D-alanyl-D-alanine-endopeptidase, partial [Bacteroidales bacterium]|nr:D-alanyl-D-alanine carboxypeptidase/D-alanyl-D-alanine-endopeptidase [Bacteroidales bacterium]